MLTKEKGDIALGQAIAYFLGSEYEVCIPVGDKRDYDLVVEKHSVLYRVQVKYAGLYTSSNDCRASLRVMGGNQSYNTVKRYSDNAFEYLFVYTAKHESFLIPWKDLKIRNVLCIESPIYSTYKIKQGLWSGQTR
ncbi:MAG TPA: group I intron-associated PD-(D/E)XK endonuclease [Patescibacteria group bacterium]|nr:group I intron-associated PD-(D/E)XK endonuclease [Patescibacteria group bacterium]